LYALGSDCPLCITELEPAVSDDSRKAFRELGKHDVTGWSVWGSSVVLSRFLAEQPQVVAGERVLELGAGCGLPRLLAAQRCSPAAVVLTDWHEATLSNLRANVTLNAASLGCPATVSAMDWDEPATWPGCPFPVVLGADLLYRRSYARKLAAVLAAVVQPGGVFVCATPAQREGLPTLQQALLAAGWACEVEMEAGEAWRANPLQGGDGAGRDAHFPELAMRSHDFALLLLVFRRPTELG